LGVLRAVCYAASAGQLAALAGVSDGGSLRANANCGQKRGLVTVDDCFRGFLRAVHTCLVGRVYEEASWLSRLHLLVVAGCGRA